MMGSKQRLIASLAAALWVALALAGVFTAGGVQSGPTCTPDDSCPR